MNNYLSREFDFETHLEIVAGATIQRIVDDVRKDLKAFGAWDTLSIENHDGGLEFEDETHKIKIRPSFYC